MSREIVRFSPVSDFDRFFGDDLFSFTMQNFTPAVDIYQDDNNLIVEVPLPGVDPKKVKVSVENDVLTISGKIKEKKKVKKENFYHKEIRRGSFSRSIILPVAVKGSKAKAEYDNGILKIILPKSEDAKSKKITVNIRRKKK